MFVSPNFTFNGIYSKDMNVSICTVDDYNFFNDIGVEYTTYMEVENSLVDYHPYFSETFDEPNDIELNLLIYDSVTMEAIDIDLIDMEEIYDWLITDDFVPFISDDDLNIIYYFKVTSLIKVLTFNNKGYLRVIFKPYSKYCYKRKEYEINVNGNTSIDIFNLSRKTYYPMIEITNNGNVSTINKINNMEITNVNTNETIIIDNLNKIVQNTEGENKFNSVNRKWIELVPRTTNVLTLSGNCSIKIICEYPILK